MGTLNLHRLFNPKAVAVTGASGKKGSAGWTVMTHLLDGGFKGDLFFVNPETTEIMGRPCYPDVEKIGTAIDTAVITDPAPLVPGIIESCGRAGLAGVVILSSLSKEPPEKKQAIETALMKNARKYNLRILGPDSRGFVNTSLALNAGLVKSLPPGKVALLSWNTRILRSVMDPAHPRKAGFSHFICLGSMLDIDFADMIDYLGAISTAERIAIHLKQIPHLRKFMSAARSVSRVKPLIVLKSGRAGFKILPDTVPGGKQTMKDAMYDAAFRRAGILRVHAPEALLSDPGFLPKLEQAPESGLTDQEIIVHHFKAQSIIKKALTTGKKRLSDVQAASLLQAYGFPVSPVLQDESRTDCALMMGMKKDSLFGPVIVLGKGKTQAGFPGDLSIGLPPLNQSLARQMIRQAKIPGVLAVSGQSRKECVSILEELLIRVGRLATDFPEISAVNIFPLRVHDERVTVEKARISVTASGVPSPMHLIISAYPRHYEKTEYTIHGKKFFIRPIRPSDEDLLIKHFNSLSSRSVYMRFFSPLKKLSRAMLVKLTQIDYDREIALAAIMGKETDPKMVGVCRIILEPDHTLGEFAMAISDEWHGKGIGSSLLKQCLKAAQSKGIKKVIGIVLAGNTQMLKLGSKLGFTINKIPGGPEYEMIIDYNNMHRV